MSIVIKVKDKATYEDDEPVCDTDDLRLISSTLDEPDNRREFPVGKIEVSSSVNKCWSRRISLSMEAIEIYRKDTR